MDRTQELENNTVVPSQSPIQTAPPTPLPSTTPELEQILVKIQELEQRIGDCELKLTDEENGGDEMESGKYEKLFEKSFNDLKESLVKSLREEIKGTPEIEKNKKTQGITPEDTKDVPQSQTSDIDRGTGEKTGAPVAGEETGLDKGEPAEDEAEKKVPKPSSEYPKSAVQKNALDQHDKEPEGQAFIKKKYSDKPNEMEDKKGKKISDNTSDGFEENYKYIQSKLSGRQSFVGAGGSSIIRENYMATKDSTNDVIREYLTKVKVRI